MPLVPLDDGLWGAPIVWVAGDQRIFEECGVGGDEFLKGSGGDEGGCCEGSREDGFVMF